MMKNIEPVNMTGEKLKKWERGKLKSGKK